jgi:hypothetical protein
MRVDYDKDQLAYALADALKAGIDARAEIQRLRFDVQRDAEHHDRMIGELEKVYTERDDALEKVKELIYIADRAIALADIDFENDKFGVVSELRGDLEKIKKSK